MSHCIYIYIYSIIAMSCRYIISLLLRPGCALSSSPHRVGRSASRAGSRKTCVFNVASTDVRETLRGIFFCNSKQYFYCNLLLLRPGPDFSSRQQSIECGVY